MGRAMRASRELAEVERWPRARVERLQRDRLDALAPHASEHSAFWRERLPHGPVELSALPVLTKAEMMERFDELVTDPRLRLRELLDHLDEVVDDSLYLGEYRAMTTSGSSGRKGVFVYDRAGWRSIASMFLRRSGWVGVRPRLPRLRLAMIAGGSPTHMSQRGSRSLDVGVHRLCALAATQPLEELVEALNSFQPQFMNTYPSTGALLAEEESQQSAAVAAAQRALDISLNQYRAGLVSYLQVATQQTALLSNQRAALAVTARRFGATVQLVRALGGGWDRRSLPSRVN